MTIMAMLVLSVVSVTQSPCVAGSIDIADQGCTIFSNILTLELTLAHRLGTDTCFISMSHQLSNQSTSQSKNISTFRTVQR